MCQPTSSQGNPKGAADIGQELDKEKETKEKRTMMMITMITKAEAGTRVPQAKKRSLRIGMMKHLLRTQDLSQVMWRCAKENPSWSLVLLHGMRPRVGRSLDSACP